MTLEEMIKNVGPYGKQDLVPGDQLYRGPVGVCEMAPNGVRKVKRIIDNKIVIRTVPVTIAEKEVDTSTMNPDELAKYQYQKLLQNLKAFNL